MKTLSSPLASIRPACRDNNTVRRRRGRAASGGTGSRGHGATGSLAMIGCVTRVKMTVSAFKFGPGDNTVLLLSPNCTSFYRPHLRLARGTAGGALGEQTGALA